MGYHTSWSSNRICSARPRSAKYINSAAAGADAVLANDAARVVLDDDDDATRRLALTTNRRTPSIFCYCV